MVEGLSQTYDFPLTPHVFQILSSAVMNLKPTTTRQAPRYFGQCARKFIANEAAYHAARALNEREKKKLEAAELAANPPSEATPLETPILATPQAEGRL
jgi:hypothetical protein